MRQNTQIIHAGRDTNEQGWMVNPPIYQSSTIVFPKLENLLHAERGYGNAELVQPYELKYGRYGTQTNFALEKTIAEIENGYNTFITSCGAAAITTTLFAFLEKGDHLLVVDNAYAPTREFSNFLGKFGIETTYFDPKIGARITDLIKDNTKLIFMESPGSLTFEIQDVPTICKVAKEKGIVTVLDNSWGSGIYYKALDHGVDISIIALTKYLNGHSDIVMGSITLKTPEHFKKMTQAFRCSATNATPFAAYMVQRGLRTVKVRMDHCFKSTLDIAKTLEAHPKVEKVLYPALESHESHELWKRDFTGAAGLFSIVLKKKYSNEVLAQMLDNLQLFGMGYSWGGYESLILPFNASKSRTATDSSYANNTCLRINIGLEDIEDLKEDLLSGLQRLG